MSTADTRRRLETAVLDTVRADGIAGLSARAVARRAGVNQALIFYHYETVPKLVEAAALASVAGAIERYRSDLAVVTTFSELLAVGRRINVDERASGNVAVMAQLVAGAHADVAIAGCARTCLDRWNRELEPTVGRVLQAGPLRGLIDQRGLVRAISSAFIGLELFESVDPDGAAGALASLEQLGTVLAAVDALGPVAHRALRSRLRRRRDQR